VASTLSSCQTEGYVINGKTNTSDLNGNKVFLRTENPVISDSTVIENGSFTFSGQTDGILRAAITVGEKVFQFYLVNDKIRIEVNNEDWKVSEVHYSKSKASQNINKYFKENEALFYEPFKQLISLEVEARGIPEEENAIQQRKDTFVHSYIDLLIEEYKKNNNREGLSVIVRDLTGLFGTKEHPEKIEELYTLMPENEKNNYSDQRIQNYFNQIAHLTLGQPVDFSFMDYNGSTGKVSDYKGKLVLIEFWATWCGPCLSQFPIMDKISAHADKIKIITISIDDNIDQWKTKIPELNTSWIKIHYRQEIDLKKHFFVNGIPDNLLLSQDGKILRKKANLYDILAILE
jgi:thiol-disulfide isomerase/thioredoxin